MSTNTASGINVIYIGRQAQNNNDNNSNSSSNNNVVIEVCIGPHEKATSDVKAKRDGTDDGEYTLFFKD